MLTPVQRGHIQPAPVQLLYQTAYRVLRAKPVFVALALPLPALQDTIVPAELLSQTSIRVLLGPIRQLQI